MCGENTFLRLRNEFPAKRSMKRFAPFYLADNMTASQSVLAQCRLDIGQRRVLFGRLVAASEPSGQGVGR